MAETAAAANSARDRHLFGPGRKRILSLDGGGVRGAVSIAFLSRLEEVVDGIEGRPTPLGDWFDLIGGTSTGAIIATALALGYRAADIRRFYRELGPDVFQRQRWRIIGRHAQFDARRLMKHIHGIVGERTLDSEDLRTGLCIIAKRLDTGSVWSIANNPRSRFWDSPADQHFIGNRHYPLANLLRSSTAAPYYFDPEPIVITAGEPPGIFVDGGVSPYNNPSLQLLMLAALPAFGLRWRLDAHSLAFVSIGTGSFRPRLTLAELPWVRAFGLTMHALVGQNADAQQLMLAFMSWFGDSRIPWEINSEIGDLGKVPPPGNAPLFRFLRYDVRLEQDWLKQELGAEVDPRTLAKYRRLDEAGSIDALYALGEQAAAKQIDAKDLLWEAGRPSPRP
jgi:hypothetical protein